MGGGGSSMPRLWDEISDAQTPLSFIWLNFSTQGSSETEYVKHWLMVEVQKWALPSVSARKQASLWHYWWNICQMMMSVSSCVGMWLQWGGEKCWRGGNMSPFTSSAWVSLTAMLLFLLITPPTNLQLRNGSDAQRMCQSTVLGINWIRMCYTLN